MRTPDDIGSPHIQPSAHTAAATGTLTGIDRPTEGPLVIVANDSRATLTLNLERHGYEAEYAADVILIDAKRRLFW